MDVEKLKDALRLNPKNGRVHADLGWVYERNGDYDLAQKELNQAIVFGFDNEDVHLSLGKIYREKEDYDLSVREFERASEVCPHNDTFIRNKILNEIEISQKKTILQSKIRGFGINLTNRCNLRCIMCQVWKTPWEMPKKTVKEIVEYFPYLESIFWQGGEVFLVDYFEEIFEKAASYPNLNQVLVTHGLFITEEWAKKLARANITLLYSIDGVTKTTYEYIRRGANFEDLLRSICIVNKYKEKYRREMSSYKFETAINVVIMKSNYYQLEQFMDFAKEYKFDHLHFLPIENVTGPENIFLHRDPEAADHIEKVMPALLKKSHAYRIRVYSWLPRIKNSASHSENLGNKERKQKSDYAKFNLPTVKNKGILCYWPWKHLFLEADGWVRPYAICTKEYVGNVLEDSLAEIWNNEKMQIYRQKIINHDYHDLCDSRCHSGVMSRECLGY